MPAIPVDIVFGKALMKLKCLIGFHDWACTYDNGRYKAMPYGDVYVWFSEVMVCCANCSAQRSAKTAEDHKLPEFIVELDK